MQDDGRYTHFDPTYLTFYANLFTRSLADDTKISNISLQNPFIPCSKKMVNGRRPFQNIPQQIFTDALDNNYTFCLNTSQIVIEKNLDYGTSTYAVIHYN